MATIAENYFVWNERYCWLKHGEEWGAISRKQYLQNIYKIFIEPNIKEKTTLLEIGPGHGIDGQMNLFIERKE